MSGCTSVGRLLKLGEGTVCIIILLWYLRPMTFQDLEKKFQDLIVTIRSHGGNLIFVGGCVRDILLGQMPKDFDAEVYGLSAEKLLEVLQTVSFVKTVGKQFGIFYLLKQRIEVALPRKENKIGKGHKGFNIIIAPNISFKEASSRRDVTINSMGYNPKTGELLDPWNGKKDLEERMLRATNPKTFGEDPLRALRIAQFVARFQMQVDPLLQRLCSEQDLSELPKERLLEEMRKLLIQGVRPSQGFLFLQQAHLLRFFPTLILKELTLTQIDKGASSSKKTFSFMLAILTRSLTSEARDAFLHQLGVSKKIETEVSLYHQASVLLEKSAGREGYSYRCVAALWYENHPTLEDLVPFLEIVYPACNISFELERHKAFDSEKIRPIMKGRHLLQWAETIPKDRFSSILRECHVLQLKEGLGDAREIWHRWQENHRDS